MHFIPSVDLKGKTRLWPATPLRLLPATSAVAFTWRSLWRRRTNPSWYLLWPDRSDCPGDESSLMWPTPSRDCPHEGRSDRSLNPHSPRLLPEPADSPEALAGFRSDGMSIPGSDSADRCWRRWMQAQTSPATAGEGIGRVVLQGGLSTSAMNGDTDLPCARALFLEGSPVFNVGPHFGALNMVHAGRTILDGEQTSAGTNGQGQRSVLCIGDSRQ